MNITAKDIKRLFPESTYRHGLTFYQQAEKLIHLFANQQQRALEDSNTEEKSPLLINYILKIEKGKATTSLTKQYFLKLELKVGLTRLYVVKNIKQFLDDINKQTPHYFTKNFSYDPTEHSFHEEDREIFRLLWEMVKNEQLYLDLLNWYGAWNERTVLITPIAAQQLLEKLQDRDTSFEYNETSSTLWQMAESDLPFTFSLQKSKQGFELDLCQLGHVTLLEMYNYLFHEGVLYQLTLEQVKLIKELKRVAQTLPNQALPIATAQIDSFVSQVIPGLKTVGQTKIDEQIAELIIQPELKAKVFVDDEEDRLNIQVEYHYGEVLIHPFLTESETDQHQGLILMRDMEKERQIMNLIEHSPLKFNGKQLYVEKTDETLYQFLYQLLPQLAEETELFLTHSVHALLLPEQQYPVTAVDLGANNLLEINFHMEGITEEDITKLLQSITEKKKYYRLANGTFVSLEKEEFSTIKQLFEELHIRKNDLQGATVHVPVYRGFQVDNIFQGGNKYAAKLGKAFRNLLQQLKAPAELELDPPQTLQATLRDYQKTGFQWLKTLAHYQLGGILADDMGLGKTLQSIAFLLAQKSGGKQTKPALVIAPVSLVYNWQNELSKFAPELKVQVFIGSPNERQLRFEETTDTDIWITSYPMLRQDIAWYAQQQFSTLIIDEAQSIKNHLSKTAAAVRQVQAQHRFALSGTPIENSLDELWSIFQTLMPGFFPSQQAFKALDQHKIAQLVRPFILRRLKKDVLKELPEKIESIHYSELSKQQKELYIGYLSRIQQETRNSLQHEGFQKSRIKILAGLTRLRQLCCHPALFIENYSEQSGKLEQLMEILETATKNGKRILVFSQFTTMLEIIRARLQEAQLTYYYLDGQTPSQERINMVSQFNQGQKEIFLISLKAGGTGLNLTGADTVILYDLWWNPAVEEQAASRAHRLGQKNVVQVIRLIAQGTIEEKIYELQQKKRELVDQIIQPGETMLTSLSEQEIRDLLSI